jgi:subtilisin family serine protease
LTALFHDKKIEMVKTAIEKFVPHAIILLIALIVSFQNSNAQSNKYSPKGWQLMDWKKDSVFGTSINKAYTELLKGKKGKQVIVAVIDGGVDTAHEDLRGHIWTNTKEIPGNGIDDDHNGYVDDIHGWNFLGGKDGRNIEVESYEAQREYVRLQPSYYNIKDSTEVTPNKKAEYAYWLVLRKKYLADSTRSVEESEFASGLAEKCNKIDSTLRKATLKDTLWVKDVTDISSTDSSVQSSKQAFLTLYKDYNISPDMAFSKFVDEVEAYRKETKKKLDGLAVDPNARRHDIVGDNPDDINDRNYGNNNIAAGTPSHGTHVSGIIAASRNNGIGMDGIADNVLIMPVRAVPDGDERDKDVALAIRYAVDNGARVINMSFGKPFSPGKKWVDDAVRYAAKKDVLLVHAAGNEAENIDVEHNYPNPDYDDTHMKADNFITVGASRGGPDSLLAAGFSNYGKKEVDLFAPGVNVYSSVPGNKYESYSGTSMASPVVAGVAALIMEYYPTLSARQVKYVLENSVLKLSGYQVRIPGTKMKADFATLSKSQGIVNAYSALRLAATLKGERKIQKSSTIKSRLE